MNESELIRRYRSGDEEAFEEIFFTHSPKVSSYVYRRISSPEDARDIVQQTFLNLHRSRSELREDAPLSPWIMTIARNLCHDHLRRQGRRAPTSPIVEAPLAGTPHPEDHLARQESRRVLRNAIDALGRGQQEVLKAHWFEHKPYATIAKELGVSLTAVKVRASRAYEALRRILISEAP